MRHIGWHDYDLSGGNGQDILGNMYLGLSVEHLNESIVGRSVFAEPLSGIEGKESYRPTGLSIRVLLTTEPEE
jgi:hypothetical protein